MDMQTFIQKLVEIEAELGHAIQNKLLNPNRIEGFKMRIEIYKFLLQAMKGQST